MKTNSRQGSAAFTLIELMAVITIIVILAGLVVGGLGYVSEKQATSKAKVQIGLLSKALEEYKLDNGTYPPTGNFATPTTVNSGTNGNSSLLYKALFSDGALDATKTIKIYLSDLDPLSSKQGWTTTTASKIVDPWGNEYLYRTAKGVPPATGATPVNSNCQNPDFDLWSAGKDSRSNADLKHKDGRDDIRNF
ncbi:MAG: type II secretion system protein GspG [Armatimonadetes bacterium]|nr:type II secretion system protein GspG [Akkermansiaceae bacterium]